MLNELITRFVDDANNNARVRNVITDWSPHIVLASENSDWSATVVVNDATLSVREGKHPASHMITLHADDSVFASILSGQSNPAEESINGTLQVYGDARDQIRLDVLTMILWG